MALKLGFILWILISYLFLDHAFNSSLKIDKKSYQLLVNIFSQKTPPYQRTCVANLLAYPLLYNTFKWKKQRKFNTSFNIPHEILLVWKSDAARADRILQLVNINAGIHNTAEQLIHNVRQVSGGHGSVQVANEHCLLWVELLGRAQRKVVVSKNP